MAKPTPDDPSVSPGGEASAAARAREPDAPEPSKELLHANRRRSDRVVVAIAIDFTGTNAKGVQFTESCVTEMVSLHGASIAVSQRTSQEHPIRLRRRALDLEVRARVLGQLGLRPGCHVYGIAFTEEAPDFWGIHFPQMDENDETLARTLLMCSGCGKQLIFTLNEIEFRVFEANQRLSYGCETCGRNVVWKPVSHDATGNPGAAANHRRHARTRMKTTACIQESGREDDVVEVLDISRGGVSFRSSQHYTVNSWIRFAVPYTQGAANIFVSGRIAWQKDLDNGGFEYGAQYVKS